MNILITGATGFIGSNLVKKFLKGDHNIFCTLLENEENPFGEENVKSIKLDYSEINAAIDFFKENKIEGIIHLAAYVLPGIQKTNDVEILINSNIKFGSVMLEIATQAKVNWFINTGTYWQNYKDADYSPVNLYAATKQAFEDIAKYYYEAYDLKFCTLRLFDTYGSNDPRSKVFNLWNKISKSGEVLDMTYGDQIMDFSYIDDIVDAYLLLSYYLHNNSDKVNNGDIYFLQSPERYTLKELAQIFEEETSTKLNINWGERPYKAREVMKPITTEKIIYGFQHKVSIREGIKKIVNNS